MDTYIALLRGINVGGRHSLPMRSLVDLMRGLGWADIRTYIQSGNAVFRAEPGVTEDMERAVANAIAAAHSFRPDVLIMPAAEFATIVADPPFPTGDGKALHCFFLASPPRQARLIALEDLKKPSESCALMGRVFYLHAPEGVARSKVAVSVENVLGVTATARNWNTVRKLAAIAAGHGQDHAYRLSAADLRGCAQHGCERG